MNYETSDDNPSTELYNPSLGHHCYARRMNLNLRIVKAVIYRLHMH